MTSTTSDAADAVRDARARLRRSLDGLSDHLSPGGALDLARSIIEDHEARRSATEFVKRNPVPTALAATGLAWLGYKLLSGGDEALADPRTEPGLTEVAGQPHGAAPTGPVMVDGRAESGRQDVPHTAPPAAEAAPLAAEAAPIVRPPAVEVSSGPPDRATGVRATFARYPLLYGVVGLVAGAITGVVAALLGKREPALDAPEAARQASESMTADADPAATCAPQSAAGINGFAHPARPDGPHAWTT